MPKVPWQAAAPLNWRVPVHVLLATAVFLLIQATAVVGLRGTADPELYPADYTKFVPVNAAEDDAVINITAILGLFPSSNERFASLINVGGPFILLGRRVMLLAGKLGLVQIFDDPAMYISYPEQYRRIWVAFGIYKLLLFLPWFPLVVYWLGRNHLSPRAGPIATWLLAAAPFVTAFEVRLKTDSPALIAGLFALLFLFQYHKDNRAKTLCLASALLGLSLSMKFLMIPALVLLLVAIIRNWIVADACRGELAKRLALCGACFLAVFVAANPRVISGMEHYLADLSTSRAFVSFAFGGESPGLFRSLWGHARHFDVFLGGWFGFLAPVVLIYQVVTLAIRRNFFTPTGQLTVFVALNVAYLAVVAYPLLWTTYFFYQPAIIALLLTADACGRVLGRARARSAASFILGSGLLAGMIALTFMQDLDVLRFVRSSSNRQLSHAFLKRVARPGDSVGIPINPGTEIFSGYFGVDPFVYRLCEVGVHGEYLHDASPDWLLMDFPEFRPYAAPDTGYAPVALFTAGEKLPHWRNNLYQETAYGVFVRDNDETHSSSTSSASFRDDTLFGLGEFIRKDAEPAFSILQFQALPLRPQSIELLRKAGDTILPLPTQAFAKGVRDGSSPLAYVHQVDRLTLAFWGIKYILTKTGDSTFSGETLASGHYDLEPAGDLPGGITAYRNGDYRGMALFLADARAEEARTLAPRPFLGWLKPLKDWGVLYDRAQIVKAKVSALEIRICLDSDGPVDILLKGGAYRRSFLTGKGTHELIATYEAGDGSEDVGYELHPAVPGTRFSLKSIVTKPLRIGQEGRVAVATSDPHASFARVWCDTPGRVVFAQPFLPDFWRADVDGRSVKVRPGPANTVSVDVPTGPHLVSIMSEN
jgi:hypothetical protein